MSNKEIVFKGKDGKDYAIQIDKVTYYRSYVDSNSKMNDKPTLKTCVYLIGSVKALIVPISFDEFRKKRNELVSVKI